MNFFSENGYEITSDDEDYITIKKNSESNGCLTIFIISISVFSIGYLFLGVFAIFLSIIALIIYSIDYGKDYIKVIFDHSGNRIHLTSGSIYSSDKVYYLSDINEVKLVTKKFDSFTSAFRAGNKDYIRKIYLMTESTQIDILSFVSNLDSTEAEIEDFLEFLKRNLNLD